MNKLLTLLLLATLTACSNYMAEDEELNPDASTESGNAVPMTLKVRSSAQENVNYPVQVYIFKASGEVIKHSEITSDKQNLDVKLPIGKYELATFSGLNAKQYQIPEQLSLSSMIAIEDCKPCPTPLQYGYTSFSLQNKLNLSIHLSYIVSSLEFKFQDIPEDAKSVEVGISPTSAAFSFGGTYSNDKYMCRICCQHINNEWIAGPIYILPSNQSKTTLTLFIERPSGEETLAYTYASNLEAAQPYRFTGRYSEGINLGGSFDIIGWKPNIDIDFDFSEEGEQINPDGPEENHPVTPSSSTIYCTSLPQAGDFYENHYVWKSEFTSDKETRAIILSQEQWFNILAIDGPSHLESCNELQLNHWRVFTKEEAKEFNSQFAGTLPALNGQLSQHEQDELYFYNGERYLCDDCLSAFNLKGSSSVRVVGKKQTYYMKALHDVTFKVK